MTGARDAERVQWLELVSAWVRNHSGRDDIELEEVVTQPWSTVWRSVQPADELWFKEARSANLAEGPVHNALAELAPHQVTAPVAWDAARGWLLTTDGGETLLGSSPEDHGLSGSAPADILVDYATLQLATVDHQQVLVTAGLPEAAPQHASDLVHACVNEMAAQPVGDPRHVTRGESDDLRATAEGAIRQAARALAEGAVPMALDHNDLFAHNVFVPRGSGHYTFFDFAESLWAHPFGSLLMLMWELIHVLDLDVGDAGPIDLRRTPIRPVFDRYLEQWSDYADGPDLRLLAGAALQIAPVYRASTWLSLLRRHPKAVDQHGSTPLAWIFDVARPVIL